MAWSRRRPPGPSRSSGRGGSTASTAAKIGSGISTMPAPPPNGRVVDRAVHVGGVRRAGRGPARRAGPAAGPCPSRLWPAKPSTMSGKMVKTSMRTHGDRLRPRRAGRTGPAGTSTTRRPGRRRGRRRSAAAPGAPVSSTSRSLAGLSCTASTTPRSVPSASTTARADELVHPEVVGVVAVGRLGPQHRPGPAPRPPRGWRRPRSATTHRSWCGRDAATTTTAVAGRVSSDPGLEPLGLGGGEGDHDLAAEARGPCRSGRPRGAAASIGRAAQSTNSTSTSTPSGRRRRGRRCGSTGRPGPACR